MSGGLGSSTFTTGPIARASVSFLLIIAGSPKADVRFSDSMKASGDLGSPALLRTNESLGDEISNSLGLSEVGLPRRSESAEMEIL